MTIVSKFDRILDQIDQNLLESYLIAIEVLWKLSKVATLDMVLFTAIIFATEGKHAVLAFSLF